MVIKGRDGSNVHQPSEANAARNHSVPAINAQSESVASGQRRRVEKSWRSLAAMNPHSGQGVPVAA